ncbi:family 43 glycosylhydrolase [Pseudoduganella armeniaca]|uniref:Family 43 glycosylhydrolase n=1 Tax=Pseudoduganella armeniaca TaxID=2072590 RepID=A0A2R4CDT2_9BURK|nr:family 43 glycosylhydrolase [Pseudoduganella armeniaca]AVR97801.1 hypothetical protein C9I28_20810 [Pseudoduganella armeniaca]
MKKSLSRIGCIVALAFAAASPAWAQVPTVSDLVDNNRAFLKLDRTNTNLGASFNMHFIDTVTVNGVIKAYYIRNINGHLGVGLAESTDGVTFVDKGPVLESGAAGSPDSIMASFPGVWYENGTYYMVYESTGTGYIAPNIGLATSTDGKTFTKKGLILRFDTRPDPIDPNKPGWESRGIGTPSIYKENGIWYVFYHGFDGTVCQIGMAKGTDLMALQKVSTNPVIRTVPGTPEAGTAGRRKVIKQNGAYYMVYEVSDAIGSNGTYQHSRWSSAFARSSNLTTWTKFRQNPILPQTDNTTAVDSFGNDGPAFLNVGGRDYVYYRIDAMSPVTRRALVANEQYGGFDRSWTMTAAGIGHNIGRADGDGWSANMTQDTPGYLQFGPYYAGLPEGDHIATWSFMIDNNTSDDADQLRLEIVDVDNNYAVLHQRTVTRKQFKQTGRYEYFSLPFHVTPAMLNHRLEYRVYWHGRAFIREGKVGLS